MMLLWTKSTLPTGPIICWGLDEPVSHFSVVFFNSVVLHSNFTGLHCESLELFLEFSEVKFNKKYAISNVDEVKLFVDIICKYYGSKYDWKWFFSLIYYVLRKKIFSISIPNNIKWQSRHRFLCSEVAGLLKDVIGDVDIGSGSPYRLAIQLGAVN